MTSGWLRKAKVARWSQPEIYGAVHAGASDFAQDYTQARVSMGENRGVSRHVGGIFGGIRENGMC